MSSRLGLTMSHSGRTRVSTSAQSTVLRPGWTTHMSIDVVTAADRASWNSRTSPAPARAVSRGNKGR
jgi:hypothetical protein